VIRALLKLRMDFISLQKGSLELIEELPSNVLGYARQFGDEKIVVLLNFDSQEKQFEFNNSECVFRLPTKDERKKIKPSGWMALAE
jgi:hypothetical protein